MRPSLSSSALLISLLALTAHPGAFAQSGDTGGPPPVEVTLRSRAIGQSDLGASGAAVSQSSVGVAAELPFPVAGGVNGKLGVSLDEFELKFDSFDRNPLGTSSPLSRGRIARIAPSLNFSPADNVFVFAGPQWELSAAAGAATGDSVQWSATFGAVWLYRPGLTLVGGFVYAECLGYPTQYLPIAGFDWRIDSTWNLSLTGSAADYQAPVLKLTREASRSTRVFAQLGFESGYVRLRNNSPIPGGTLRYTALVPQVGVEWRPTPTLEFSVFAGMQLDQEYRFKNRQRQMVLKESAQGAAVFGARLTGRF